VQRLQRLVGAAAALRMDLDTVGDRDVDWELEAGEHLLGRCHELRGGRADGRLGGVGAQPHSAVALHGHAKHFEVPLEVVVDDWRHHRRAARVGCNG